MKIMKTARKISMVVYIVVPINYELKKNEDLKV